MPLITQSLMANLLSALLCPNTLKCRVTATRLSLGRFPRADVVAVAPHEIAGDDDGLVQAAGLFALDNAHGPARVDVGLAHVLVIGVVGAVMAGNLVGAVPQLRVLELELVPVLISVAFRDAHNGPPLPKGFRNAHHEGGR